MILVFNNREISNTGKERFSKKFSYVHLHLVVHTVILPLEEGETGGLQVQSLLRDLNETEFRKKKEKRKKETEKVSLYTNRL